MPATDSHYAEFSNPAKSYVALLNDEVVAESSSVVLLSEHHVGKALEPVVYFPPQSVNHSQLHKTERTTYCPIKGTASYWSFRDLENALWAYEDPDPHSLPIRGHFGFDKRLGFVVRQK